MAIENLVLRQQLAVLKQRRPRPRLTDADRLFWVVLSKIWPGWREPLHIVQPETIVRWHRQGFRYYWRWKSGRRGRPRIYPEIRDLIRRMCQGNPLWGAPRIHGELLKLGIEASEATVSKYMIKRRGPPSQTWRTFLENHAKEIIALDFFTVPTATFRILFVLIILSHDRRRILHVNVTTHPTAAWTARQLLEACGTDVEPRYLLRDRDAIYGKAFRRQVTALGINEVTTAPRSPWQNPYAERLIGSIRRECLDHMIITSERHLKRILSSYVDYYHSARTHLSLEKDAPEGRVVQPIEKGRVVELKRVGGLHHLYTRMAA
ncbi:MAG: integrase core domain-containing protein [Alphaproteobacteria bacterium]|nr:integrase core domain-containing protein [Alphaproteobacteria bacterium]